MPPVIILPILEVLMNILSTESLETTLVLA